MLLDIDELAGTAAANGIQGLLSEGAQFELYEGKFPRSPHSPLTDQKQLAVIKVKTPVAKAIRGAIHIQGRDTMTFLSGRAEFGILRDAHGEALVLFDVGDESSGATCQFANPVLANAQLVNVSLTIDFAGRSGGR